MDILVAMWSKTLVIAVPGSFAALNSNILLRLQNIQLPGAPTGTDWQMQA